jgi:hypothetical protein
MVQSSSRKTEILQEARKTYVIRRRAPLQRGITGLKKFI